MNHPYSIWDNGKCLQTGTVEGETERAGLQSLLTGKIKFVPDAGKCYRVKVGGTVASSYGDEFAKTAQAEGWTGDGDQAQVDEGRKLDVTTGVLDPKTTRQQRLAEAALEEAPHDASADPLREKHKSSLAFIPETVHGKTPSGHPRVRDLSPELSKKLEEGMKASCTGVDFGASQEVLEKALADLKERMTKEHLEALRRTIEATPVDTGRFRDDVVEELREYVDKVTVPGNMISDIADRIAQDYFHRHRGHLTEANLRRLRRMLTDKAMQEHGHGIFPRKYKVDPNYPSLRDCAEKFDNAGPGRKPVVWAFPPESIVGPRANAREKLDWLLARKALEAGLTSPIVIQTKYQLETNSHRFLIHDDDRVPNRKGVVVNITDGELRSM